MSLKAALTRRINTSILLLFIAAFACRCEIFSESGEGCVVTRVIDGDTIRVIYNGKEEKVRFTGIDTPEMPPGGIAEYCGPQARKFLIDLLRGKRVELVFDEELRDKYGRLLAYVYIVAEDGVGKKKYFVNAELIKAGFAKTINIPPNVRHAKQFKLLEDEARGRKLGVWGKGTCAPSDGDG